MRKHDQFDEAYFQTGFGPDAYARTASWLSFYSNIVDNIIHSIGPRTVLDAGCALGMVVEAFWDRGVEAKGLDISEYAISNVRPDMREHCKVASLVEPIEGHYDLIVCIEVLEHMPIDEAKIAISNFASATDTLLFSSTPYDFEEVTHVNVRPTLSWLKFFMSFGFVPDVLYDASFITPHAILFRKGESVSDEMLTLFCELLRLKHLIAHDKQLFESVRLELEAKLSHYGSKSDDLQKQLEECQNELTLSENGYRREIRSILDQISTLEREKSSLEERILHIESRRSYKIKSTVQSVIGKASPRLYNRARQIAKAGYWILTPHKMPSRIEFIKRRNAALASKEQLIGSRVETIPIRTARSMIEKRFQNLAPLPVFEDRASETTVTVLTDSVDRDSLFGGVATSLIAGLLISARTGSRFRLVTRTSPPDPAVVGSIMKAHNIDFTGKVSFSYMPLLGSNPLPVSKKDIVLTTSWWTTQAALGSISPKNIIYILQEDERMFYPYDDMRVKCNDILSNENIFMLVNTHLLFDYFKNGSMPLKQLTKRAVAFEPAFPTFPRPARIEQRAKRNFFFYARPNHPRNLFWHGLEVVERALQQGVLRDDQWIINFVGDSLETFELSGGVQARVWSKMPWTDYAKLASTMDLGLSLMDTPHPSYPPLDLAASGAIVVTNQHGPKTSLEHWSKNIITASLDLDSLVSAIGDGVRRAGDLQARYENCMNDGILRDWETGLGGAIDRLLKMRSAS